MTTMSHHLPFQSISPHDSSLKLCFVSCQILQNYQFVLWFLFVTIPLIIMGVVTENRLCSPKIFGTISLRKGLWLKRQKETSYWSKLIYEKIQLQKRTGNSCHLGYIQQTAHVHEKPAVHEHGRGRCDINGRVPHSLALGVHVFPRLTVYPHPWKCFLS